MLYDCAFRAVDWLRDRFLRLADFYSEQLEHTFVAYHADIEPIRKNDASATPKTTHLVR
jgi:hypothetical protein